MVINNYLLSNNAKKDLEDILHYISVELMNSESANKSITEMEQKFVHIVEYPYAYPIIEEFKINRNNLRKCRLHNYLIVYHVNEEMKRIEVVRVLNQRMDIL